MLFSSFPEYPSLFLLAKDLEKRVKNVLVAQTDQCVTVDHLDEPLQAVHSAHYTTEVVVDVIFCGYCNTVSVCLP